MNRKKNKNSNAGMTLLEVIVAVSIFSITAIVLLQSFVTSSRINRKSNTYLEATTVAQNVMEEIKAKRFQEVALAFNYPIDLTTSSSRFTFLQPQISEIQNNTLEIKEIAKNDDGKYTNVRKYNTADGDDDSKVTASVISHDDGKTYKFNANDTGKYYYSMANVKNLNETFDVLVEFDGGDDTEYRKKTVTNNVYGKNDLFAQLIILKFLLPDDEFKMIIRELKICFQKYPVHKNVLEKMGFPEQWEKIGKIKKDAKIELEK